MMRLRLWLLRWLGFDGVALAQLRADLDGHTEVARLMAEQLNRTTMGAADAMRRLAYYEQHVESIRYAHGKLKQSAGKPNGESRIITLHD